MKPRISMITLGVRDLERATRFYQYGLGLPRREFSGDVSFFELNGSWLALYGWEALAEDAAQSPQGGGFRGVSLAHNVESPEQVDALVKQAVEAGGRLVKPPQPVSWGGYAGYFADPDGHLWEVAWNPHFWPGPSDLEG